MTDTRRLRVLVVDDHDVVHWGFRLLFTQQDWVSRCLSARNSAEAVALAQRYEPHVALVDLFVGEESGAEVCSQLRVARPGLPILLISGSGRISAAAARAAGASGFVSKDWPSGDVVDAVRMVGTGLTVFEPQPAPLASTLTVRERHRRCRTGRPCDRGDPIGHVRPRGEQDLPRGRRHRGADPRRADRGGRVDL
jgi:DNA-binding NarL/FixJ family response regulator